MFKKVLGTRDILPEEISLWQTIEEIGRKGFSIYNYKEIRTPLIEEAVLFNRSLGESTEVVQKQMFLIPPPAAPSKDEPETEKGIYSLRPEGTASIVRAYIENHFDKTAGLMKLYYIGPMFRRERPQKGRLRQFHHIGCEVIGSDDASVDVEVISLAGYLLKAFLIDGYKIKINSLGCIKDRKELIQILSRQLKERLNELCGDCHIRFKRNILRILDCKNEACRRIVKELDIRDRHLCPECRTHFAKVRGGLDLLKVEYIIEHELVRGLDYYTRTVFEIIHEKLGAQDALGAGGRYDNLISDLGGQSRSATGFALGIERLLLVSGIKSGIQSPGLVYIISLGEEAKAQGLEILESLRKAGIASDTDYENKSLKGAMRRANDLGARFVLIIGEDELKKDAVTLKDMASGEQKEVAQPELLNELKDRIK